MTLPLSNVILFTASDAGPASPPRVVSPDGSGLRSIPDSTADVWNWVVPSRDGGTLAGFPSAAAALVLTDSGGGNRRVITNIPSDWHTSNPMSFSPDGKQLAGLRTPDPGLPSTWEIIIVNTDNSGYHGIGVGAQEGFPICWSPNGRKLAFTASDLVGGGITQCNVDGSGRSDLANPGPSTFVVMDWFSDSQHLLVADNGMPNAAVVKAYIPAGVHDVIPTDPAGGITNEGGTLCLSPDDSTITFQSTGGSYGPANGLATLDLATLASRVLVDPATTGLAIGDERITWVKPLRPGVTTITVGAQASGMVRR